MQDHRTYPAHKSENIARKFCTRAGWPACGSVHAAGGGARPARLRRFAKGCAV